MPAEAPAEHAPEEQPAETAAAPEAEAGGDAAAAEEQPPAAAADAPAEAAPEAESAAVEEQPPAAEAEPPAAAEPEAPAEPATEPQPSEEPQIPAEGAASAGGAVPAERASITWNAPERPAGGSEPAEAAGSAAGSAAAGADAEASGDGGPSERRYYDRQALIPKAMREELPTDTAVLYHSFGLDTSARLRSPAPPAARGALPANCLERAVEHHLLYEAGYSRPLALSSQLAGTTRGS